MRMMREGRNKRSDGKGEKLRPFLWGGAVLLLGLLVMTWWGGDGIEETEVVPGDIVGRMVIPEDSSMGEKPELKKETSSEDRSVPQNPKGPISSPGEVQKAEGEGKPAADTPHVEEFTFYKTLAQKKPVGISEIKGDEPVKKTFPRSAPSQPKTADKISPPSNYKMYTIQVAAFREKDRAEGMIENLKQKGYPAYLHVKEGTRGPDWFRVRVGKFPNPNEAHRHAETIRGKEGLPPFVTLTSN